MALNFPDNVSFEGREVPIYSYEQLHQQPRQKLKNRAMDLRDLVGADRLPALCSTGSVEAVTTWILDVQCALAKSAGYDITPEALGKPANYGNQIDGGLLHPTSKHAGGAPARQPMQEIAPGASRDAMAAYESAMAAAAATRARNQQGSNIFG